MVTIEKNRILKGDKVILSLYNNNIAQQFLKGKKKKIVYVCRREIERENASHRDWKGEGQGRTGDKNRCWTFYDNILL